MRPAGSSFALAGPAGEGMSIVTNVILGMLIPIWVWL